MPSPTRPVAVDTRPRMRTKRVVMIPKESVQAVSAPTANRQSLYPVLVFVTVITALLAAVIVAYISTGTGSPLL